MSMSLPAILATVVPNPWLAWGLLPALAFVCSFVVTCVAAELALRHPAAAPQLISYPGSEKRPTRLAMTQAKIPIGMQLYSALTHLCGPSVLLNGVGSALLLQSVVAQPAALLPGAWACVTHLLVMAVVGDFVLYWGHRVQHEVPFLWERFHSLHHQLDTPTPLGTLYIHPVDVTLQGGLSLILAAAAVQPHPVTFWFFVALRVAENVLNHSGLRGEAIDAITLKCLPLRAKVAHHDAHHRYGVRNFATAKNYGETFWVWDWAFGTLAKH